MSLTLKSRGSRKAKSLIKLRETQHTKENHNIVSPKVRMVPTNWLTWRGYMSPQLLWSAIQTPTLALLESVSMDFNLSQSNRCDHRRHSRLLMTLPIFYRVNLRAPELLIVLKTSIWSSFTKLKLLEMLTNWQIMTQRRKIFCLVAPVTIFFTYKSGKRRQESHLVSSKLWIWSLKKTWILFKTGVST